MLKPITSLIAVSLLVWSTNSLSSTKEQRTKNHIRCMTEVGQGDYLSDLMKLKLRAKCRQDAAAAIKSMQAQKEAAAKKPKKTKVAKKTEEPDEEFSDFD